MTHRLFGPIALHNNFKLGLNMLKLSSNLEATGRDSSSLSNRPKLLKLLVFPEMELPRLAGLLPVFVSLPVSEDT